MESALAPGETGPVAIRCLAGKIAPEKQGQHGQQQAEQNEFNLSKARLGAGAARPRSSAPGASASSKLNLPMSYRLRQADARLAVKSNFTIRRRSRTHRLGFSPKLFFRLCHLSHEPRTLFLNALDVL